MAIIINFFINLQRRFNSLSYNSSYSLDQIKSIVKKLGRGYRLHILGRPNCLNFCGWCVFNLLNNKLIKIFQAMMSINNKQAITSDKLDTATHSPQLP